MFKYMVRTHSTRFPCSPRSDPFNTLSLFSSCMGSVASLCLLDPNFAYRLVWFLWCLEKCRVNPLGWGIAKIRGLGQSDSQSRSWFWESPLQMSITHPKAQRKGYHEPKATLDEGPGSNFLRTNLDWFEANCILELDCTLVLSLILGSPNQELSF